MSEVRLRRLGPDDIDEAALVHRTSFDERLPWLMGLHTPDQDRWFYRERVLPGCTLWGATMGGGLVGIVAFREGWIDQLYVLPDAQGRGVGTSLLDLEKRQARCLSLWTFRRNTGARRFYERRGFVAVEETDGSGNEEREPDVPYHWSTRCGAIDDGPSSPCPAAGPAKHAALEGGLAAMRRTRADHPPSWHGLPIVPERPAMQTQTPPPARSTGQAPLTDAIRAGLRRATPADAATVRDLVRAAYAKWVPVLGREPKPMTADYEAAVRDHLVDVLHLDGEAAALIEMEPEADHLLVVNVAVSPGRQGQGLGRALLAHSEEVALSLGLRELRLYTSVHLTENVRLYERVGYGVDREELASPHLGVFVHMSKHL